MNQSARPPTIPSNTNFDNNYSYVLKTKTIQTQTITDGTATLSGGYLTGIQNPLDPQDAVPKSYITGSNPGGTQKCVQYNYNGLFAGSSNFKYLGNNTVGTLKIPNVTFTDGILDIQASHISNLQKSSNSTSLITKSYCDFLENRNYITISSTSSTTYSAQSIVNGTIIRTNAGSSSARDYLPAGSAVISYVNSQSSTTNTSASLAVAGTYYNFSLINKSNNNVIIFPNTNTTIYTINANMTASTNILVPPYYTMCGSLYVDTSSVVLYVDRVHWSVVYQSNFFNSTGFETGFPYYIKNNLLAPAPTSYTLNTSSAYTYTQADINQGIYFRDPTTHASDSFLNILNNSSFVLQNVSTVGLLNISTTDCTGSWLFYRGSGTTSSLSIGTGSSMFLYFNDSSGVNVLNVLGASSLSG